MNELGNGEMNTAAIHVHELYMSYTRAGFSEEQAFELTKLSLMAVNHLANGNG